jgi:hypothetical protein
MADRLIADMISWIGEPPNNPVISPGSIFPRYPHNQRLNFFVDRSLECARPVFDTMPGWRQVEWQLPPRSEPCRLVDGQSRRPSLARRLRAASLRDPVRRNQILIPQQQSLVQSGRIEARTGLRMMPTSPRSSLRFRTAGFPSVRLQGWLSDGAFPGCCRLKPAPGVRRVTAGLLPSFVHLVIAPIFPYCAESATR